MLASLAMRMPEKDLLLEHGLIHDDNIEAISVTSL